MPVLTGDCREVMATLNINSVDAIVTDPPYGLSFMGKEWDHGVPGVPFWREALRVLKPGGHLLAFGGSRTFHRLVCAIEDAGFDIRDQIMWIYGSGFPKGCNFTTQFDEALLGIDKEEDPKDWEMSRSHYSAHWEGFNVALKPAHEPICVARKPLEGTVAANVLKWGAGAINVDGCRVGRREKPKIADPKHGGHSHNACGAPSGGGKLLPDARWPANVIHDGSDEVLAGFPEAPGQIATAKTDGSWSDNAIYGAMKNVCRSSPQPRSETDKSAARFFKQCEMGDEDWHHQQKLDHLARNAASRSEQCETHIAAEAALESKGKVAAGNGPEVATRFVYCPKASKKDRDEGLEGFALGNNMQVNGPRENEAAKHATLRANTHPTVKPTDLMRYLCRLVTPPGGLVLDPFCGSGSTGKAAVLEGFRFLGVELSEEYAEIARARIEAARLAAAEIKLPNSENDKKQLSLLSLL